jgi:hypothetical protein
MKKFRAYLVLLTLVAVLAACGSTPVATTPTTAPEPTAAEPTTAPTEEAPAEPTEEAPAATTEATQEATSESTDSTAAPSEETATSGATQSDEEIIAALQKAVDTWTEAYEEVDVEKLRSVIDPKALSLRRTQGELFKARTESIGAAGRDWSATVAEIEPLDLGYVLALVDIGTQRFPFTFKQVDGEWMMSEPKRAEIGKKQKQETEHFVFEYYPWSENILPDIIELMENAQELVVTKMGRGPEKKPIVRLIPTTEVGNSSGNTLAFYQRGTGATRGTQTMVINSPESYGVVSYDREAGWKPDLQVTLAHEFVHLVNDCCFVPIAEQNDWMTEGLAEYISDGPVSRQGQVALAVQSDAIIPIQIGESERFDKQDLEHLTLLDRDVSLAYGLSSSIVDYIVRNYGGLDGYWKLIGDYRETQNFDQSLQNVLGITFQQFDEGWRADLKEQFGG